MRMISSKRFYTHSFLRHLQWLRPVSNVVLVTALMMTTSHRPDTFRVFNYAKGNVNLTTQSRHSGYRSVNSRRRRDKEFPQLQVTFLSGEGSATRPLRFHDNVCE